MGAHQNAVADIFLSLSAIIEEATFIACPPLFKVERGRNHYYCYSDRELTNLVQNRFPSNANYTLQRFQGLGEMMPQQLQTTMNPDAPSNKLKFRCS